MSENSPTNALNFSFARLQGFLGVLFSNFARHQGMQNAGSLTYTTLLSLVPLMTVTIAVFSAFPVADRINQVIQDFLFQNFVPTSGEVLQQYLEEFSSKASRLTGAGFAFLILVALMMMATIDRVINDIWEVRAKRPLGAKFLIYWAVLSLGPVLIGASVVVTSYIISLPILSDAVSTGIGRRLLGFTPVAASTLAFALVYAVIPNTRVSFRQALLGGLVAAILFELAKRGFGAYITAFPAYEAIYGALATIPIFLVWVFLSWVIVLLGAEFTRALGCYQWALGRARGAQPRLLADLEVLMRLDTAAASGQSVRAADFGDASYAETILHDLSRRKYVSHTDKSGWVLTRRLDSLSLLELFRSGNYAVPQPHELDTQWAVLSELLDKTNKNIEEHMDVALSELRS